MYGVYTCSTVYAYLAFLLGDSTGAVTVAPENFHPNCSEVSPAHESKLKDKYVGSWRV